MFNPGSQKKLVNGLMRNSKAAGLHMVLCTGTTDHLALLLMLGAGKKHTYVTNTHLLKSGCRAPYLARAVQCVTAPVPGWWSLASSSMSSCAAELRTRVVGTASWALPPDRRSSEAKHDATYVD